MDREQVIKEWENVLSRDPLDTPWDLIDDTLTLLKDQEIIGHWEEPEDEGIMSFHPAAYSQCSVCKRKSYFGHKDRFCRHCGAKMDVKEETP